MIIRWTVAFILVSAICSGGWRQSAAQPLAPPEQPPPNQDKTSSPLEERVRDICALFRTDPGDYDKLFNAAFLAQVPESQL